MSHGSSVWHVLLLVLQAGQLASAGMQYQGAVAPPPAAAVCQGWCPKWTCCKTCDDPACSGCGATRKCSDSGGGSSTEPAQGNAESTTEPRAGGGSSIVPPGFQTGSNGFLMENGKRFTIKGINWWGTEGTSRTFGGLKEQSMDELLDFISEQGFNAIRILVNHRAVMINGKIPAGEFDEGRTPELVNMRYLDQIDLMVSGMS